MKNDVCICVPIEKTQVNNKIKSSQTFYQL